jgi:hypothetical protein
MPIAEAFSNYQHVSNFPALEIPMRALVALSKPSLPEEVRDVAIEKAAKGEKITIKKAEAMVTPDISTSMELRHLNGESSLLESRHDRRRGIEGQNERRRGHGRRDD